MNSSSLHTSFPPDSQKAGKRSRFMKSLLLASELLQADQHLFKHSKVAHMEQSIKTAVEVIEVWNENSLYEMTPERSKEASVVAVFSTILGTFRSDYDYEYEYEFFNVNPMRMPDCVSCHVNSFCRQNLVAVLTPTTTNLVPQMRVHYRCKGQLKG